MDRILMLLGRKRRRKK